MPKKTNKTDRVLSLLSNDQPEQQEVNNEKVNKTIINEASNVSVINQKEVNDEIEIKIEASLEKELDNENTKTLKEQKEEEEKLKELALEKTVTKTDEALKAKKPVPEEDGHVFISVMEYIVKLRLDDYIKDFDVCKCTRCKADIVALALTNLPSKYVVTASDRVSPLLNFYENKYLGQVAVELTKACMRVAQVPHHRD